MDVGGTNGPIYDIQTFDFSDDGDGKKVRDDNKMIRNAPVVFLTPLPLSSSSFSSFRLMMNSFWLEAFLQHKGKKTLLLFLAL